MEGFDFNSAVVEDRFLCRHVGSNFIPTATFVDKTMVREINVVMFRSKSKLRITRWIIGTGRVNSGWLSIKHAAALTCNAFCKQSSLFEGLFYLYFVFLNESFLFQNSTLLCRQNNLYRHVVFSQTCCSVANFVNKALVDDSTRFLTTTTL